MLGAPGHASHSAAANSAQDQDPPPAAAAAAQPASSPSSRALVLASAALLHRGDLAGARRAAAEALSSADPRGDSADRLAHHFARALSRRAHAASAAAVGAPPQPSATAYLAYNQIAPFLRFAHLTANQAILDAAATATTTTSRRRCLHIVDLDAAHGVQWPPLLQAIADRAVGPAAPPEVRITGAGTDRDALLRTGDRLRSFAASINLPFRFHPLLLLPSCTGTAQQLAAAADELELDLRPDDETLAVNCVLFLHKLAAGDGGEGEVAAFLKWVKSLNPAVVTIAEKESTTIGGGDPPAADDEVLQRRVAAAMDYYAAVFDALEATAPPGSADRLLVESEVLGGEIDAAVGRIGGGGEQRYDSWAGWGFEKWAGAARAAGLSPRPLSAFAVSQARLLLRLHYPSEGYVVAEEEEEEASGGACFLGWKTRPLMSVSSWQ